MDWGPKSFKMLDCWFSDSKFIEFVEEAWRNMNFEGWVAFVLKEKLKELKKKLKTWDLEPFGNLERKQSCITQEINLLEIKEDHGGLNEEEKKEKNRITRSFLEGGGK